MVDLSGRGVILGFWDRWLVLHAFTTRQKHGDQRQHQEKFIVHLFNLLSKRALGAGVRGSARHDRMATARCHRHALQHTPRSEEHTSELQSLMRISYAVFRLQ